jgi:NAD(P)-dependent dehydrogenase (short-subunit alcohol dehydrogenase family)
MAWTTADIPDQQGRTALITGANVGVGFETAAALAGAGARTVLACRDRSRAEAAAEQLRARHTGAGVEVLEVDLGDLSSVRRAASEAHSRFERIDVLINNAGVMVPPLSRTTDGFELQMGVNHLGHFALTGLVLDLVPDSAESRIVTVSSLAHDHGSIDWADLNWERSYRRSPAYGRSKLANLLFAYELARRLERAGSSVVSVAVHPGVCFTELNRHTPGYRLPPLRVIYDAVSRSVTQTAAAGALPSLRAATEPGVAPGTYYGPDGRNGRRGDPVLVESNAESHDRDDAHRLWELSEDLTGVHWSLPTAAP